MLECTARKIPSNVIDKRQLNAKFIEVHIDFTRALHIGLPIIYDKIFQIFFPKFFPNHTM